MLTSVLLVQRGRIFCAFRPQNRYSPLSKRRKNVEKLAVSLLAKISRKPYDYVRK